MRLASHYAAPTLVDFGHAEAISRPSERLLRMIVGESLNESAPGIDYDWTRSTASSTPARTRWSDPSGRSGNRPPSRRSVGSRPQRSAGLTRL
jgi:hypothetical protein